MRMLVGEGKRGVLVGRAKGVYVMLFPTLARDSDEFAHLVVMKALGEYRKVMSVSRGFGAVM